MIRYTSRTSPEAGSTRIRRGMIFLGLAAVVATLGWRAIDLHVIEGDFLRDQGKARQVRVLDVPAHRGLITDRNGQPLAISAPIRAVWINPQKSGPTPPHMASLAQLLGMELAELQSLLQARANRSFVYLSRQVEPEVAEQIADLEIPGVGMERAYRRFYPSGEVSAHLVGFTNIDDQGQEGIELAYEDWLRGKPGEERIVRDGVHRVIAHTGENHRAEDGGTLVLSIDQRLQYLAYRELKSTVQSFGAKSGSAVMMDATTGEVLVMVNQPSYNPNSRKGKSGSRYRNRAVTDVFEPGSTVKPFIIASGLESGLYQPDSVVEMASGQLQIGTHTIRDHRLLGSIDLETILKKSSNVGAATVASTVPAEALWSVLAGFGFGVDTGSSFPGERSGVLPLFDQWQPIDHATLGFGYGLSTTVLQMARAYSALAAGGQIPAVSLFKQDQPTQSQTVISRETATAITHMLESVVSADGTGRKAQISGYRVAGKTGTVRKAVAGGYSKDQYLALFAGYAPASDPRFVLVVMVDEPKGDVYYGGEVAAPVFSRIMSGALRLMDVSPDAEQGLS